MKQLNILVIDDNHDLADGLGMILEDDGHQIAVTYNGADAIKEFDNGSYDLVFIDVKLPDMNGVEVFQNIHKKDPEVNIFMMTGYRIEQLLSEVVDKGSVSVLRDPFDMESVTDALNQIGDEGILLIADDHSDCVHDLISHLSSKNIKLKHGSNKKEIIEDVLSNPVEVLILDLHMPVIYGLEVYLELKQKNFAVKTIIITGCKDDAPASGDVFRSTPITGCLFKPFNPEYMLNAIEQM